NWRPEGYDERDPRLRDQPGEATPRQHYKTNSFEYAGSNDAHDGHHSSRQGGERRRTTDDGQQAKQEPLKSDPTGCPFKFLGLDPNTATLEIVRSRYRELVKTHHPDVGGCPEKFKKIRQCYDECKLRIEAGYKPGEHDENTTWEDF